MDNVIVTITNSQKSFLYDIEAPNNVPVEKLIFDIADVLNNYVPELSLNVTGKQLFCSRLNRIIGPKETFEKAGVWNGDYLVIVGGN